jgi:O-antigen/teichoic acid export membrane protein
MPSHTPLHPTESSPQLDSGEVAIRGGAIRVVGYVSGVVISLGAAAILVRHLGISVFGRYVTVISLVALVGGVTEAGIAVYGIREFATRNDSERRALLADLLGMRLTLTAFGIACAVVFALAVGYGEILVLGTVLAGVGLLVQVIADVLSIPLQASLRLGRLTVVDLTRRVLALVLIGALAIAGAGLLPFFAVSIPAGALALLVLARMVRSSAAVRANFAWSRWGALFRESLPFALAMSVGAIYFYVTIIVMSLIASDLQTGFFATSFRVTQVALAIPGLLLTAVFPLMTRPGTDRRLDVGSQMGRIFDVALLFGVWMSLAIALGASFIIKVVGGAHAHGAVPVLRIQGLVLTASFISAAGMLGLLALRRYRPMLIATASALIVNVALGVILIPVLHAQGGAVADALTETFVALGLIVTLRRMLPQPRLRVSVLPRVVLAGGLASAVWLLPIGAVARVIVASLIYFGILVATGAIPEEVTKAARLLDGVRSPT